ncbi:class I adenylate-forming enzyme family protein [Pseudorhodoferax sp.]|uniref:class I adenylate-forming enzyme family protein n=1 Tax=Pseudorhodoferax sp. TaxID=1993553 RepID=UPI002DD67EFE|nr:AMP-binding protein [Pseudorhodoferax sp.]
MGGLLAARARVTPHAIALEDGCRALTFAELDERVRRMANWLCAQGVARGDRIAVLSENRLEYVELVFAAARLGAIVACQNWRLAPPELRHCIRLVAPRIVLTSARHADLLRKADHGSARVQCFDDGWREQVAACSSAAPAAEVVTEDALLILYTSGTTGAPKGAVISHRAELARRATRVANWGLRTGEVWVVWTPLFHMSGVDDTISALLSGARVVLVDGFDVERIVRQVATRPLGWLRLMPGMLVPFLQEMRRAAVAAPSVRLCGGLVDLLPSHQVGEVSALLNASFLNSFGSTEVGTILTGLLAPGEVPPDASKEETTFSELRLVDAHGRDVPDGAQGELVVRSATMFSGYWQMPELNGTEFRDGWFRTGDMFVRRPDGRLHFVDRSKYLIKSGGENIYPAEIERVIGADARVLDVVVVRQRDDHWGEVPVALVVRKDPSLDGDALQRRCREALAGYKQPKRIHFVADSALPRSTTGKIQRHEVERMLASGTVPAE